MSEAVANLARKRLASIGRNLDDLVGEELRQEQERIALACQIANLKAEQDELQQFLASTGTKP